MEQLQGLHHGGRGPAADQLHQLLPFGLGLHELRHRPQAHAKEEKQAAVDQGEETGDQNFPAALPSLDGKCPAIIHVEGGLLSELGDFFYSLLKDFTLPEGSVLLIGSLSHLMEEGLVGYAKGTGH